MSNMKFLKEIDGWQTDSETKLLIKHASQITKDRIILEIGSWKGKSTLCLLHGAQKHGAKVVAVDTFRGSEEHGDVDTYAEFTVNINKYAEYIGYPANY